MTFKQRCDCCKRVLQWIPDGDWSTLVHKDEDRHIERLYICAECTEKMLRLFGSPDDWRFEHG